VSSGILRFSGWWTTPAGLVWRPDEEASVRFSRAPDYTLSINGHSVADGELMSFCSQGAIPQQGALGFSFDVGTGTIDNVSITGRLDMSWFAELTKNIR
jgi:hypothetical protein